MIDVNEGLTYSERRWSFVARQRRGDGDVFVKIPKSAPAIALADALRGAEERRIARNEYETLRLLRPLATDRVSVVEPLALGSESATVVTRFVDGLVPLSVVLDRSAAEWAPMLADLGQWLRGFHEQHPDRLIDGFKLDNVLVDPHGRVVLVDPNELMRGPREHDLARFCISLLSRGYERARLPLNANRVHAGAFLAGYGLGAIRTDELAAALDTWARRQQIELRAAARIRRGRASAALLPWLELHERLLRRGCGALVNRVVVDAGVGDEMGDRYTNPAAVVDYRRQQDAPTLRTLRLATLARAEIAAVESALRRVNPAGVLLDLPAGTGKLWPLFALLPVSVVAGDLSTAMLDQAAAPPNVLKSVIDARDIPFPDRHFDGVISLRLLHRLPPADRRQALSEFSRVASRWVIASFAITGGLRGIRYRLVSWMRGSTAWAPHPLTPLELEAELRAASLEIIHSLPVAGLLSNEVIVIARPPETP